MHDDKLNVCTKIKANGERLETLVPSLYEFAILRFEL